MLKLNIQMFAEDRTLVKRANKVSFLGVIGSGSTEAFTRMRGFSTLSKSKNPQEYTRHYVDEEFEETDVTGYSPSIAFTFDQYKGDAVSDEMVAILDGEFTGTKAVRNIVTVDMSSTTGTEGTYKAVERAYAIVGDGEADGTDAYVYTGNLRSKGSRIEGTATISADGLTATFTKAV